MWQHHEKQPKPKHEHSLKSLKLRRLHFHPVSLMFTLPTSAFLGTDNTVHVHVHIHSTSSVCKQGGRKGVGRYNLAFREEASSPETCACVSPVMEYQSSPYQPHLPNWSWRPCFSRVRNSTPQHLLISLSLLLATSNFNPNGSQQ